jgi:hypothetical protein
MIPNHLSEHDFRHRKEHLNSQIRQEQISQLEHRLRSEKAKTLTESRKADAEEIKASDAQIQVHLAEAKLQQSQYKLTTAQTNVEVSKIEAGEALDFKVFAQSRRTTKQQAYLADLENMNLSLGETLERATQRRQTLQDEGIPITLSSDKPRFSTTVPRPKKN